MVKKYLGVFKSQQHDNSVTITIPKEVDIKPGTKLVAIKINDQIVYAPISPEGHVNRFASMAAKKHDFNQDIEDLI